MQRVSEFIAGIDIYMEIIQDLGNAPHEKRDKL
jgi:hypothetical protein